MKILHFADLHLGVENYGHIDPETGLSTRILDVLSALDYLVDYAIKEKVDMVLFCGDTYKSREPSQTHQREFARRIARLSEAGVPTFLLIGNHDLPNAFGRATSTEIFDTLAVKSIYVSGHPEVYRIPTKSGIVQVASLPWLRRSALVSRDDTRSLNFEQINQKLQSVLAGIITAHISKLDPALPAVLAAHVWVTGAMLGTEKMMTIGQEHTLMPGSIAQSAFDYVALGHIHRGQVLSTSPPVVYSGSLARLDFGDEGDEKGFYLVEIGAAAGRREVRYAFHPVGSRRFVTISVTLAGGTPDPMATILDIIRHKTADARDAIVRLQLTLPAELEGRINDAEIRDALKDTHCLTIARDIRREARLRLGKWAAEEITPLTALKVWLETKNYPEEYVAGLLEYGGRLVEGETGMAEEDP